jgi:hypothetical protein
VIIGSSAALGALRKVAIAAPTDVMLLKESRRFVEQVGAETPQRLPRARHGRWRGQQPA